MDWTTPRTDKPTSWNHFFPSVQRYLKIFFVLPLDNHSFHTLIKIVLMTYELHNSWYASFGIKLLLQTTAFLISFIPTLARLLRLGDLKAKTSSRWIPRACPSSMMNSPQNPLHARPFSALISHPLPSAATPAFLWPFESCHRTVWLWQGWKHRWSCPFQPLLDAIRLWSAVPRQPQNSCPARSGIGLGIVLAKMPFVLENY